jgi:hypothetical protein
VTAPLRSTQFYEGTPPVVGGVNTWSDEYTVPAGHRIIVKSVHSMNNTASAKIAGTRVKPTITIRQVTLQASGTAPFTDDWSGWVVLNPGEIIQCLQQPGGAVYYIVSGYLLYI